MYSLDRREKAVVSEIIQRRHLVTEIPGPHSRRLHERRIRAVSHAVSHVIPIYIARADGAILEDVDGNRLIDFASGIGVTTVGNTPDYLIQAICEQTSLFTHTCFSVSGYESYIALAEALNRITPGTMPKRSVLFNSGAEAVENAIKIARSYTHRSAVVSFHHGFHGRTNLTMALTAKVMPYKNGFGPFAPEIYRIAGSYPYRDQLYYQHDCLNGADLAQRAIQMMTQQIHPDNIAAVIAEPIQGEGGFIVPAAGFLPTIAQWCQRHGIVFIADEVQSGLGRTGKMFACEYEGLEPDLICTAKALAGGLPLSAVTGRAEMMDYPQAGGLGGTFGGNPLACVAALSVIDALEHTDLLLRASHIGEIIFRQLGHYQKADPRIGDIRGRGAMCAFELVHPDTGEPDADLAHQLSELAHRCGVVVLVCGTFHNVVRLLPPLTITDELLLDGLDVLMQGLGQLSSC